MITSAPHTDSSREELLPLLGFIAVAGPPPFVAIGAVVLGGLMLAGPFAVIVTLVLALALVITAVVVIAGAVVAIAASPFAAVRHLRAHPPRNPFPSLAHRTRVAARSARVAS